jgi:hypothetical protein
LAALAVASGPQSPTLATGYEALAAVREHGGDASGARTLLEQALVMRTAANGPDHPRTADAQELLAEFLSRQTGGSAKASRSEAASLLDAAAKTRAAVYGEDHPRTVATRKALSATASE